MKPASLKFRGIVVLFIAVVLYYSLWTLWAKSQRKKDRWEGEREGERGWWNPVGSWSYCMIIFRESLVYSQRSDSHRGCYLAFFVVPFFYASPYMDFLCCTLARALWLLLLILPVSLKLDLKTAVYNSTNIISLAVNVLCLWGRNLTLAGVLLLLI